MYDFIIHIFLRNKNLIKKQKNKMAEKFKFSKKGIKCPECPSSDAFFPIVKLNGEIDKETGKCFSCGQFFTSKSNFEQREYEYETKPKY